MNRSRPHRHARVSSPGARPPSTGSRLAMRGSRLAAAAAATLALGACASRPPAADVDPTAISAPGSPDLSGVDVSALRRELGLESADLGYAERAFETCSVGYGFSRSSDCRKLLLVAIRYQILCRKSDGTEASADSYATFPVAGADLVWRLAGQAGLTRTDADGRGEITLAARSSPREQTLRLTRGNDFLALAAEDLRRVVAPSAWCGR